MECDKSFAHVNQKTAAEVPADWWQEFRRCRRNPSPFNVVECTQDHFFHWTEYLKTLYVTSCPFQTRPIRVLQFKREQPRLAMLKENYAGRFQSHVVTKKKGQAKLPRQIQKLYTEPIPLCKKKHTDIMSLVKFVGPEAKEFYAGLRASDNGDSDND